jgi:hypothetical protein
MSNAWSANTGCTNKSNNQTNRNNVDRATTNMDNWANTNNNMSNNIMSNASNIIAEQNSLLQQQNEQLNNKRMRNEIQLNAIEAKKNIINTRARMLQIAQENNVYKQKIIYTLIAFIFAVFIAILVMYVFYSKKK